MNSDYLRSTFPDAFAAQTRQTPVPLAPALQQFVPRQPNSLAEAGIEPRDLKPLLIRFLFLYGQHSGIAISRQLKLPLRLIEPTLQELRAEQVLFPRGSTVGNDFIYEITPKGAEKAQLELSLSTYCGSAPVSIEQYAHAIARQSLRNHKIKLPQIIKALADFSVSNLLLSQLGQAVSSGKTLMLYGPPGNGKSVLSKQMLKAADSNIWIPRVLALGSEIIRVFDPSLHVELPFEQGHLLPPGFEIDDRWVYVQRPTIVVGGELELSHLDITQNPVTRILEAPIQVKSNCGCLVIDDFGRQRTGINELLNRWIVPMDTGFDYITLPSGRQLKMPFDQLLVFSTNLPPRKLTDEAFLRRIPYKIEIKNPTEEEFLNLFFDRAGKFGIALEPGVVEYLLEQHFRQNQRELRFCYVEDLLNQVREYCNFHDQPLFLDRNAADIAALNYLSQS